MDGTHPKSILELLTHPNPATVHRELNSSTLSSCASWQYPKRIIKWTDFQDLQILKQAFGGRLYQEACHEREGFRCFPEIFDQEKTISSEDEVRDLTVRWHKAIILAGHKPIAEEFHPLLWVKGDRLKTKDVSSPLAASRGKRKQPQRSASNNRVKRLKLLSRNPNPDSGAISPSTNDDPNSENTEKPREEKFPMELKMGAKWKSEYLKPLLEKDGAFKENKHKSNAAMPIRQAFTYSVEYLCRYGCIMTDREVFLFQISSLDEKPENGEEPKNDEELKAHIKKRGKMEYVAIPHSNHCLGNLEEFDKWTVNLAIWFMHIVAAQSHQLKWSYESWRDFPVGSTDSERPALTNRGILTESNETAGQEVEEREQGEVHKDVDETGAIAGPDDSQDTISISGSDDSMRTRTSSKDDEGTELDSNASATKRGRSRRRTKKMRSKG
ncbi:unnamed protein product [Clonostachys rosea]|uniref:Uncharacterized protein n=1 Tax=Bionectria ochroleuca TaxID=29856 RepID=A0ABY6U6E1_BIOOC|nr:unnamed protein product [Clonostachys rosea]